MPETALLLTEPHLAGSAMAMGRDMESPHNPEHSTTTRIGSGEDHSAQDHTLWCEKCLMTRNRPKLHLSPANEGQAARRAPLITIRPLDLVVALD